MDGWMEVVKAFEKGICYVQDRLQALCARSIRHQSEADLST